MEGVALSFVQRPEDVEEARRLMAGQAHILSKLEKPSAVERLETIVELSDAVMVARGDLGVELPPEDVPSLQKRIIRACRRAGKPVVVATQMLESMLSAESAAGQYPAEAVAMMDRIIHRVELDPHHRRTLNADAPPPSPTDADAISAAAHMVAGILPLTATVAYTTSGFTSLRIARERPETPILSVTPRQATARRLTLVWGVHSVHSKRSFEGDWQRDTE